jgi:hypothetical protein
MDQNTDHSAPDDDAEGCDIDLDLEPATSDEDLPQSEGGVAQ